MYFDTHCHLQFNAFNEDRAEVSARAKRAKVRRIIIPATKEETALKGLMLARQYPGWAYAAVGIHPIFAHKLTDLKKSLDSIQKLAGENPVIAVGEIGLDYFHYKSNDIKARQKILFHSQLEMAQTLKLPIILHCRGAWSDILEILPEYKVCGVAHCFSGGRIHLRKLLEMGWHIGIDGNITYDRHLSEIIKYAPLERILLETDAPYLTPEPLRGRRNEPAFLKYVSVRIAEIFQVKNSEVAEKTSQNALRLFDLS